MAISGDQIGGQFAKQKNLGPQYLWVDEYSEDLLLRLGLKIDKKKIRIGYFAFDMLLDANELSEKEFEIIKKDYARKTRNQEYNSAYLSQGQKSFLYYDMPVDDLVKILLEILRDRIIIKKCRSIDLQKKTLYFYEDYSIQFNNLISTVPAPTFLNLIGREDALENLKSYDKAYVKIPREEWRQYLSFNWFEEASKDYDYVYVPSSSFLYHRVKFEKDFAVVEFTLSQNFSLASFSNVLSQPKGQIISGNQIFKLLPKYVTLLGRYAEWTPGMKTNAVIQKVITWKAAD